MAESIEGLESRIREAAKFLGGIKALAAKAGIPLSSMNEYLGGAKLPADRLVAIAHAADLSLDWLATGEGEMRARPRSVAESIIDAVDEPFRRLRAEGYGIAPPLPQAGAGSVPVLGLAECGLKGWYQEGPMRVRAMRPGDLLDPQAFAVIAIGKSMQPAGIEQGFLCFCSPAVSPDSGDAIYVERRSDKAASIKLYGRAEPEWIHLQGWLDPDDAGRQAPYTEQLKRSDVARLAVIIYVKRKL